MGDSDGRFVSAVAFLAIFRGIWYIGGAVLSSRRSFLKPASKMRTWEIVSPETNRNADHSQAFQFTVPLDAKFCWVFNGFVCSSTDGFVVLPSFSFIRFPPCCVGCCRVMAATDHRPFFSKFSWLHRRFQTTARKAWRTIPRSDQSRKSRPP